MIQSFIATIKVKPGHEADFESLARKLVTAVNTNERGCLLYTLNKGEDPHTFVFMERYVDEEAVKAHRGTEHYRSLGREMGPHMDGPAQVLRLQEVG
jgi:quinol monooxygenase YgiN